MHIYKDSLPLKRLMDDRWVMSKINTRLFLKKLMKHCKNIISFKFTLKITQNRECRKTQKQGLRKFRNGKIAVK